jgi:hypothetical protein
VSRRGYVRKAGVDPELSAARSRAGRIGGLTRALAPDRSEITAAARRAQLVAIAGSDDPARLAIAARLRAARMRAAITHTLPTAQAAVPLLSAAADALSEEAIP